MSGLPKASLVVLYVADPSKSADFYSDLLNIQPVESSPGFVMMPLTAEAMLGLWARDNVLPAASAPGGSEIVFTVENADAVRALHERWNAGDSRLLQAPCELDFGFTFVIADPDGHRLRVMAPKS